MDRNEGPWREGDAEQHPDRATPSQAGACQRARPPHRQIDLFVF